MAHCENTRIYAHHMQRRNQDLKEEIAVMRVIPRLSSIIAASASELHLSLRAGVTPHLLSSQLAICF